MLLYSCNKGQCTSVSATLTTFQKAQSHIHCINGVWSSFLKTKLVCSIYSMRLRPIGGEFQYYKVSYPVFAPQSFSNFTRKGFSNFTRKEVRLNNTQVSISDHDDYSSSDDD